MSFNESKMENIVLENEFSFENKKYLYIKLDDDYYNFSGENPSLIVAMSTHNFYERYYFLKGLFENRKCDLVFIKDPGNTYYLECDQGESFKRLLESFINIYGEENITLFGSSMSGYGAIYHALNLNLNAIVSNPQINFQKTYDHAWNDLRNTLDRVEKYWVNLEKLIDCKNIKSVLYVSFGDAKIDKVNVEVLLNSSINSGKIYFHKVEDLEHGFYFKNPENVFNTHKLVKFSRKHINLNK